MQWKLKAAIQNTIARLPTSVSYWTLYQLQRRVGGLKRTNPVENLIAGIDTWRRIIDAGCHPADKTFFEVGTGTAPIVPLAYWLLGARHTITLDINPYLKEELIHESVDYVARNRSEIEHLFGVHLRQDRLDRLIDALSTDDFGLQRL